MSDRDTFGDGAAQLSAAGLARREAIKTTLRDAVTRRGRRRRSAQALLGVVLLALAVRVLLPFGARIQSDRASPPRRSGNGDAVQPVAGPPWEVVVDDPGVLDRYSVTSRSLPPEMFVGDEELQQLLAAAGRGQGIVRIGDQVAVATELDDWRLAPAP